MLSGFEIFKFFVSDHLDWALLPIVLAYTEYWGSRGTCRGSDWKEAVPFKPGGGFRQISMLNIRLYLYLVNYFSHNTPQLTFFLLS